MKVAVYTIALNEAAFVPRYMESIGDADVVLVADTGSDDGTADLLAERGAIVPSIHIEPWRFDDARNASLALVPGDVDVCLVVDLDETLTPGWRSTLESEWGDATRGRYLYVFSHHADGSPAMTYWHDRAHARHGFRWVYACHEHLAADRIEERYTTLSLEIHQYADSSKPRGHYLPLLEVNAAEHPHVPRAAHYLGREYMYVGRWADAIAQLERHVTMPESIWRPERAASCRYIARCLASIGDADGAVAAARQATAEAPELRESWVELAQVCHDQQLWTSAPRRPLGRSPSRTDRRSTSTRVGRGALVPTTWRRWPPGGWATDRGPSITPAPRAATEPDDERLRANVDFIVSRHEPTADPTAPWVGDDAARP